MREARVNAGLTLIALSKLTGIKYVTISAWENGTRSPGIANAELVADALGLSLDEYVGHTVIKNKEKEPDVKENQRLAYT